MKAICRDSFTHLPSDRVEKDESNYETEGEKRTSYNESCGCFDICKPVHVRASRGGMIKSRHMVKNAGEPCALSVSYGLQVPIGDSLTTSSLTHTGANVSVF